MNPLVFRFAHGLGDAANFAHALPLWKRRGYDVRVLCSEDKAPMFKAAGVGIVSEAELNHEYNHPPGEHVGMLNDWAENKCGWNMTQSPMPDIGDIAELWDEMLSVRLTLADQITAPIRHGVDEFLASLPSAPILIHSRANTTPGSKNLSTDQELDLYRSLLRDTGNTLVLLDWDNRVSRIRHYRVRHLSEDFHPVALAELWYLISRSALVIGVDSGVLHFTRTTDTPAIGLWNHHHPAKFALPRASTLHLTDTHHGAWNSRRRHSYNVCDVSRITGSEVSKRAARLIGGESPADLVIDNVLGKLNQLGSANMLYDRDRTFRAALDHLQTIPSPLVVETGCAREADDWGAGFSTYVFGLWLRRHGGHLDSVDLSRSSCDLAREWSSPFASWVSVHEGDSLRFLTDYPKPVDLVYLDSLDTGIAGHEEHGLAEAKLADRIVKPNGLILFDDTWYRGKFCGKGAQGVPWLLCHGWKIKEAGYQVLLERRGEALAIT